jgi:HEAT repeat protein
MCPINDELLNELLRNLEDPDESVRRAAIEELGECKEKRSIGVLTKLLEREHSIAVLEAAGNALALIGGTETVESLLPLLGSPEAKVRNLVSEILVDIGSELHTDNNDIRKFIVDILGEMRNNSVVPFLMAVLNDSDINVVCAAVESLGKMGDARAVPVLIDVAKSGNLEKGCYAVVALGKIKDSSSVVFLASLLDGGEPIMKYAAIDALGDIGDPVVIPSLSRIIAGSDAIAQKAALKSIGKIGICFLEEVFRDTHDERYKESISLSLQAGDKELKKYALIALGSLNQVLYVDILVQLLKEDEELAPFVTQDFVRMGKIDSRFLITLAEDADVRATIAIVLGDVQDAAAAEKLIELSTDADPAVRRCALLSLGKIGEPRTMGLLL